MATATGQVMKLGTFIFSINTATYDSLNRTDEWGWQTQERLLNVPAEQFTHFGSTNIVLEGSIYPLRLVGGMTMAGQITLTTGQIVGTNQLDALRALANQAGPQSLVDGSGKNYGQFVILKITEGQTAILDNGAPRKQEFKIELRSYGPDNLKPGTSGQIYGPVITPNPFPTEQNLAPLVAQAQALKDQGRPVAAAQTQFLMVQEVANGKTANDITSLLGQINTQVAGQLETPIGTAIVPSQVNLNDPTPQTKAVLDAQQLFDDSHHIETHTEVEDAFTGALVEVPVLVPNVQPSVVTNPVAPGAAPNPSRVVNTTHSSSSIFMINGAPVSEEVYNQNFPAGN